MQDLSGVISQDNISSITVVQHINAFLEAIILKKSSKQTYASQLRNFCVWLKAQRIQSVNEQAIGNYIEYLNKDKHLSDLSIHGYLTALKSYFSWLQSKNICLNITKNIQGPPKKPGRRKECLTNNQVKALLAAIDRKTLDGKRDFALINLVIWAGLNGNELTRICKGDIANCCGSQLLWIQKTKDSSKNESILLPDTLFKSIINYLESRQATSDTEPLFASHSKKNFGQSLTARSISRIIKNRLKAANINSGISANCLRYTAIRLNLISWATPEQANKMIQAADINTMLAYTRHLKKL